MSIQIGFIGLGNMGRPMVLNLLKAGYEVTVYDKQPDKMFTLQAAGVKVASSPAGVAKASGLVITMVSDDAALLEVVSGTDGIAEILGKDGIHIAMSTVSPKTIEQVALIHQAHHTRFLSAQVLGRAIAAEKQELAIILSGPHELQEQCSPILQVFGSKMYDFGDNMTAASTAKLAINFMILSAIAAMGEAFAFIKTHHLDGKGFSDLITQTIFSCPGYQYHANNILNKQFEPAGFRLSLGMKDLSLFLDSAQSLSVDLPIAQLLYERLASSLEKKRGDLDWAAITLESLAGPHLLA